MSERPRVVHVINGLDSGGAEIMLLEIARQLVASAYEPVVIGLKSGGDLIPTFAAAGIRVHVVDMKPGRPSPRHLLRLVRILRAERPAVIQTWMYHANLLGGIAARLAGNAPVAWGIHHTEFSPEYLKRSSWRIARAGALLSRRLPKAIVCCAEASRRIHEEIGFAPERMVVIPNGFDVDRFHPDPAARLAIRAELGLPPDTPLVGMLARFNPQKDHENFVRAAAVAARTHPDAHFLLAGFGVTPDNAQLAGWIAEVELADRFHLLGRRGDTPAINAALDVACLSSWNEAFPLVIGEAMACGVPCAVTDAGDAALIVADLGRVAPPKDPEALGRGIADLLALPRAERERIGAAGRRRVVEHYGLRKITADYEAVWERIRAGTPLAGQRQSRTAPCV